MSWFTPKRIFLDYASATPVLSEVGKEMERYFSKDFYNPNAIYKEGVEMKRVVDECRVKIAALLGVAKQSIVFTSGGTEANTLAVRGVRPGRVTTDGDVHPSVLEAIRESKETDITLISSVTTDNKLGRQIREERKKKGSEYPLLHIDASQSALYFPVGLEALACDMLTLDAAKLYGPKGVGVLVVKRGVELDLPPHGTPPVPLIVGMTKASELAVRDREAEYKRLSLLSNKFVEIVEKVLPQAEVTQILPNTINVSVPGILPELLVLALDRVGIMVSAGPACNSNKPEPPETPVRFSLGKWTTENEVLTAAKTFCREAQKLVK